VTAGALDERLDDHRRDFLGHGFERGLECPAVLFARNGRWTASTPECRDAVALAARPAQGRRVWADGGREERGTILPASRSDKY
jgi:hypothetical protein